MYPTTSETNHKSPSHPDNLKPQSDRCAPRGASWLTVAEAAARLSVGTRLVLRLIAAGKLRAVNVSVSPGRPTWRITPEAVAELEAASHSRTPTPPRRRRRVRPDGVIAFYG